MFLISLGPFGNRTTSDFDRLFQGFFCVYPYFWRSNDTQTQFSATIVFSHLIESFALFSSTKVEVKKVYFMTFSGTHYWEEEKKNPFARKYVVSQNLPGDAESYIYIQVDHFFDHDNL